jgi:sialate O-acetylesterase
MFRRLIWSVSLAVAWLFFSSSQGWAGVKVNALFADNMVLQRSIKAPVWGTADPGEEVTVTLGSHKASATADSQGRWKTELAPMPAGGPFEMTVAGKNTLTIHNVAVGEVWICSGQSNMEMAVSNGPTWWGGVRNADQEVATANYPMIRHFGVKKAVAGKPQTDVEGQWLIASPQTTGQFTAVGYFFGREVHRKLGVPVGLIHTSWGGTPAEAWTSYGSLAGDPALASIVSDWEKKLADYPAQLEKYRHGLDDWSRAAPQAEADGKAAPRPPEFPDDPQSSSWRASGLFNAMIAPLIPFGIRGAIWYQGESNADRAEQYRKLFPAMISDWRRAWGEGDFPFLFVQLAGFEDSGTWPELREAQAMTLSLPKTGLAVAADIGERYDIHPKNKQEVGRRLALDAEAIAYGRNVEYSGPVYDRMKVEGNHVTLQFKRRGGGLVARGRSLSGFEIAGDDRKFVPADAQIQGGNVVVSSPKVAKPAAVRYAWRDFPECSLYNKAGLPAPPFRTDDWPPAKPEKK